MTDQPNNPSTTPSFEKAQPLSVTHPQLYNHKDAIFMEHEWRLIQSCTVDRKKHEEEISQCADEMLYAVHKAMTNGFKEGENAALSRVREAIDKIYSRTVPKPNQVWIVSVGFETGAKVALGELKKELGIK